MKKALLFFLVLGLLGGGGYAGYRYLYLPRVQGTESGRVSSSSEDAVHVDSVSMLAGIDGSGLTDRYGGETVAQATLSVKKEEDRKVKEVYVKKGDVVKEGAKLFTYDTTADEDEIVQGEIDIEKSKNDIEQEQRQIETFQKQQKNASSEEDRLSYQTQILTSQSEIKRLEYEIQSKEREIEQFKEKVKNADVTAEMGGIIQKIADSGNSDSYYGFGGDEDNSYITILATGDYRIEGKVNEQNIQNIYEGMPMIVFSRVDSTKFWKGTISEINTEQAVSDENSMYSFYSDSGAESSSYKFYVELEESAGLMLGQHVYMEQYIGQDKNRDGIWLQSYYFLQDEKGSYVWKANEKNQITRQEVTLGELDAETGMQQVLEGLSAEDYIAFPMNEIAEGNPVVYNDLPVEEESEDWEDFEDLALDDGMMTFGGEEGLAGEFDWEDESWDEEDWEDESWDEEEWDEEDWDDEGWEDESDGEDTWSDETIIYDDAEEEGVTWEDAEEGFYDADADTFYDADEDEYFHAADEA